MKKMTIDFPEWVQYQTGEGEGKEEEEEEKGTTQNATGWPACPDEDLSGRSIGSLV